jgi:hypothetical protein
MKRRQKGARLRIAGGAADKRRISVSRAIAQLKQWASLRRPVTLGLGVVTHRGMIVENANGYFQFKSGAYLRMLFMPSLWCSVRTSHIPELGNSIIVTDDDEKFTLTDIVETGMRRSPAQRKFREEAIGQLKAWASGGTPIVYGTVNEIGSEWFAGKLSRLKDDWFSIDDIHGTRGAVVMPEEADRVHVQWKKSAVMVFLHCGEDAVFLADRDEELVALAIGTLSKMIQ